MSRFVVISGCSGGGKSTLLVELRRRGHAVCDEPGRRVVALEEQVGGQALPWVDLEHFLRKALDVALDDYTRAFDHNGWVFFDRGLIDAAVGLSILRPEEDLTELLRAHPYYPQVFLVPPWPEIYVQDDARRHTFADAVAEFETLEQAYPALGYQVSLLPKTGVPERADFLLHSLGKAACR
ncbi:AAA family ATPase [Pseudomonas sp. JBR1]|uniref:AAA family ATPase n=1 Tax=Pseudomonas sp. JBR1 TaxID=3020907 RepID=UPI002305F65B|nr:AAA family ATPase [Pseudomonas sp. JBR1]WCE07632.1 AAA family ATPase [Pseudomonas sp. JBR1]